MRADYDVALRLATKGLARSDDPGAQSVNLMFLGAPVPIKRAVPKPPEYSRAAVSATQRAGDPVLIVYRRRPRRPGGTHQGDPLSAREPIETALHTAQACSPCVRGR